MSYSKQDSKIAIYGYLKNINNKKKLNLPSDIIDLCYNFTMFVCSDEFSQYAFLDIQKAYTGSQVISPLTRMYVWDSIITNSKKIRKGSLQIGFHENQHPGAGCEIFCSIDWTLSALFFNINENENRLIFFNNQRLTCDKAIDEEYEFQNELFKKSSFKLKMVLNNMEGNFYFIFKDLDDNHLAIYKLKLIFKTHHLYISPTNKYINFELNNHKIF